MKRAAICAAVSLLLSSSALAILRPPYPLKPTPPYRGYFILIEEDSIKTASKETPANPLEETLSAPKP